MCYAISLVIAVLLGLLVLLILGLCRVAGETDDRLGIR